MGRKVAHKLLLTDLQKWVTKLLKVAFDGFANVGRKVTKVSFDGFARVGNNFAQKFLLTDSQMWSDKFLKSFV